MKIIDLLNKIANGEDTPKEIKYDGYTFKKANESYIEEDGDNLTDHICYDYSNLNDEVEIIGKDKKIEKIKYYDDSIAWVIDGAGQLSDIDKIAIDKINELIDYLMENKQ